MVIDQLIVGGKRSYDDFEANVKEREVTAPKKKSIKETVPFSNKTYDFSKINGEIYWNERELTYVFEITANSPEELEDKKQAFTDWIMNINDEKIFDPFISDYHFIGSFDDIDFDDSEIEKSTITVTFSAYPYMISNAEKVFTFQLTEGEEITTNLINNSSHRIIPTFTSDIDFVITKGMSSFSFPSGTTKSEKFKLEKGVSMVKMQPASEGGTVKILFNEEVF